ncbi:sugar nucleotide-binding protein [Candidatus Peregrinibacteria bacterium]|jgi:3,5-epimerase/4-reductase|nr:sugar nucleotide-binding protein [Candidatus Peregrinibacteria bacterium]MBT7703288.1 sugar nucleotide-binding protein [Candidatus Peregrinibacteria bacterium]
MKILIYGKGYLGHKFYEYLQAQGEEAIWGSADIGNLELVRADLKEHSPDTILNCAGKTGRPNVDWCEDHQDETFYSNVTGPLVLMKAAQETDTHLAHLGSGCIYQGDNDGKGFSEKDTPNFYGSFYSQTKAWSDQMMKNFPVLILRLRMPIDANPGPRNFISKITKYDKVINIPNSMTVVEDLLPATHELLKKYATGTYNMTNPGAIDHETILDMYTEIVDPSFTYEIISLQELEKHIKAPRSNCILDASKLANEGIKMRPVEEAIRDCLEKGFK